MILLSNLVTSHVLLWGKCLPQGTTQTKVHSILQWRLELNLPRDVHARRYSTQLNPLLSVKNSQYWVKNGTAYKIVCYVSRSGIWYQTPHYVCNTQTVPIKKIISLRQYDIGSWWADTVVDPRYNQNKWLISNISISSTPTINTHYNLQQMMLTRKILRQIVKMLLVLCQGCLVLIHHMYTMLCRRFVQQVSYQSEAKGHTLSIAQLSQQACHCNISKILQPGKLNPPCIWRSLSHSLFSMIMHTVVMIITPCEVG